MVRVLLIGNGAREHVLAETICRSQHCKGLFSFMKASNPGIARLSQDVSIGGYGELHRIVDFAVKNRVDFAVVGPEDPLQAGVVDALAAKGIAAVGPTQSLARLETSKSFTRDLLSKYGIEGNPAYQSFLSTEGIAAFVASLESVVVKPDGLTGGKGVMVQGDHFSTKEEAVALAVRFLQEHQSVVIEEKLEGEEFSLQCLADGKTVVATPAVQDHKRRFNGDLGPNTGGMGSYSYPDHCLPFVSAEDVAKGLEITKGVAAALLQETGEPYRGVMYAGFMVTATGLKLLEYNARFGDPEAMNILPLLKTDFIAVCQAIITGSLSSLPVVFENHATVCKYIVPKGYGLLPEHPDNSYTSTKLTIGNASPARLYYASVEERADGIHFGPSRAVGVVGIAPVIDEAERLAQRGVGAIGGEVTHRSDIGTTELIAKRIAHMKKIRGTE